MTRWNKLKIHKTAWKSYINNLALWAAHWYALLSCHVVLSDSCLLSILNKGCLFMYLKVFKFSRWVTINDICKMSLNQSLLWVNKVIYGFYLQRLSPFRLWNVLALSNCFDSVPSLSRFPSCECQLQITVSPLLQCEIAQGAPGSRCHNTAAIFDTATGNS